MLAQRMNRLLTAFLVLATTTNAAYEHYDVPLEKADPPLMNPREYVVPNIVHSADVTAGFQLCHHPHSFVWLYFPQNIP